MKKSEPHNAAHYQAELGKLLICHDDVIDWVLTIMKMDDYYRQAEELPVKDPMTAYDEVQHYPGLFDMQQVMCRITTEADIHKRQFHGRGIYQICESPVLTTSGFVPHRPSPTSKLIDPATISPEYGTVSTSQGSSQQSSPSTDSSLPCGQHTLQGTNTTPSQQGNKGTTNHFQSTPNGNNTSPQQTAANQQQFTTPPHNTPSQNVAPPQPSAPLLQPLTPGSHAAHQQQGHLQFIQPRVSPMQRHNKIQCPTPRNLGYQSPTMDRE